MKSFRNPKYLDRYEHASTLSIWTGEIQEKTEE